jgi:acyl carrier protein
MVDSKIREIIAKHARLSVDVATLNEDSSLYQAGLTSLATVNLMMALEDAFEVEFPDQYLGRKTFESIRAIADVIQELGGA